MHDLLHRELKDALAKGVSDSDFRVYEREQAVRRELEGALVRLGGQVEGLVAENERVSSTVSCFGQG